jgi:hypothetical protein
MSITGMSIQVQRQISSPNGRQKHERNMETDTDIFQLFGMIGGCHLRRFCGIISAKFAEKDNVIHPQLQELAALRTMYVHEAQRRGEFLAV